MTQPVESLPTFRLAPGTLAGEQADAVRTGAVLARAEVGVVELIGPGVVTCFQGLLTSDIEGPGTGAFVYGALLTAKGMIITDGWATRLDNQITYAVPWEGRYPALEVFQHVLPPRLARFTDRSDEIVVLRLAGPKALAVAGAAGLPLPSQPGRALPVADPGGVVLSRAPDGAPFVFQITAPAPHVPRLRDRLVGAGATWGKPAALELARVVAGWPRLGAEIDGRTLPQEVRYDEIGGVSYTKGCYVGQETVARVHFRGHPNRHLRGLLLDAEPDAAGQVEAEGRPAGRLTSAVWLPDRERWIGLGLLRREVEGGTTVRAGGAPARVVSLPFAEL